MRVAPQKEPESFSMNLKGKLLTTLTLKNYTHNSSEQATNGNNGKIFIGHGHSDIWRTLKDFIVDTLRLPYDEFNRISPAGKATSCTATGNLDHSLI